MTTLPLVDAHCHLQDGRIWSRSSPSSCQQLESVLRRAKSVHLSHVVSCATHEADWRVLEQLLEQQQRTNELTIIPSFGVHPWWAQELHLDTSEGITSLRDTLARHPTASVGEIGLCKSARGRQVPLDVQVAVFRTQLELAAELKRTCVVHCVGYYGKLLDILQGQVRASKRLPPSIVMHSYSGPPEMIQAFLALRNTKVFFSLNAKQLTEPRMRKAAACCSALPLGVLLLETDAPDQAPSAEHVEKIFDDALQKSSGTPLLMQDGTLGVNEPAMVRLALLSAAQIRGVSSDELAIEVYRNFTEAFGFVDR